VVTAVTALDITGALLADGSHVCVDAIIAATGYRTGLAPLVGHLGVLDDRERPRVTSGEEATPGLCFIGFRHHPGLLGALGAQARRIAATITRAHPAPGARDRW
jgi:hypothetical protein